MKNTKDIQNILSYILDDASLTTQTLEGISTTLLLDIREILLDIAAQVKVPQGTYSFPDTEPNARF